MATINVYVSDDLKAAMGEHELNWSRLAADAFETAINLERTKAMSIEDGAIERLRTQRASLSDQREAEGVALGKQWATGEFVEYEQLERVAAIELSDLEDTSGLNGGDDAVAAYAIARAYLGDDSATYRDCDDALEALFGREKPSYAEVCGFVIGAAEVFEKV